jgi:hypothetical protein
MGFAFGMAVGVAGGIVLGMVIGAASAVIVGLPAAGSPAPPHLPRGGSGTSKPPQGVVTVAEQHRIARESRGGN